MRTAALVCECAVLLTWAQSPVPEGVMRKLPYFLLRDATFAGAVTVSPPTVNVVLAAVNKKGKAGRWGMEK